MIPLEEFKAENREIMDLCTILDSSVDRYSLRGNQIICELLERFTDRVYAHLSHEHRSIYRDLLNQHTDDANKIADKFLGNTQQLKRVFNEYKKDWCRNPHNEAEHARYVDESRQIFRLVCDRIRFEEETIFPFFE